MATAIEDTVASERFAQGRYSEAWESQETVVVAGFGRARNTVDLASEDNGDRAGHPVVRRGKAAVGVVAGMSPLGRLRWVISTASRRGARCIALADPNGIGRRRAVDCVG